jgi:AcrR family transcriptional regulator
MKTHGYQPCDQLRINDIIKATGVTRSNLDYHFARKEDIGLAELEDVKEEFFQGYPQRICPLD